MKRRHSLLYIIIAFVFAQFAWMGLLGLWIYWYVSNYIIFEQVGDKLSPQIVIDTPNVWVFVGGIILIVGIAIAIFFIFRHVTVQMKMTNLYDNFIANVTHELKSPLSSIQLYLETLSIKNVQAEKQKEFLDIMMRDANRLKKLINAILEISRLEQKRIAPNYHVYDTDTVIKKIVEDAAEQFRLSGNNLELKGEAHCNCLIDKEAMQIVFDNLTDNAIKYSRNPVEIKIQISRLPKKIIIEFMDKGIGVEAKNQKKIFHKFQRVDSKNIPSVKGTGLGLYRVKEIIKFHDGKISVISEGLDEGSCFRIELPVYHPHVRFYKNSFIRITARKEKKRDKADGK
jgi:two-component system, OmpR family, phosphate regulon sensor histidine kinase PhoR